MFSYIIAAIVLLVALNILLALVSKLWPFLAAIVIVYFVGQFITKRHW